MKVICRKRFNRNLQPSGSSKYLQALLICFLAFLTATPGLLAQETPHQHDVGLWVNADVQPRAIRGRWQPLVSLEYRGKDNMRKMDLFSAMGVMDYIVNKHLSVGAGYEAIVTRLEDSYLFEHRFFPQVILRGSLSNFSASLRARVLDTFEQLSEPNWTTRVRLKLEYKLTPVPLKPYISVEPFHQIIDPFQYHLNKVRYIAGCAYKIPHHQFDLYYLAEDYHSKPFTRHVAGVAYCYSF